MTNHQIASSDEDVEDEIKDMMQSDYYNEQSCTDGDVNHVLPNRYPESANAENKENGDTIRLHLKNGIYICNNISVVKSYGETFQKTLGEQIIKELLQTSTVEEYIEKDGKQVLNRKGSPGNWGTFSDLMVNENPISRFGCIFLDKRNVVLLFYDNVEHLIRKCAYVDDDIFSTTYTIISKENIKEVIFSDHDLERPLATMGIKKVKVNRKDLNIVKYLNLSDVKKVDYSSFNLNLDNNLYEELNLNEITNLFDFKTVQGRRYFSTMIRGPSRSIDEIQRRQKMLFCFANNDIDRKYPDLLRSIKKIERGKISVGEMIALCQILEKKDELLKMVLHAVKRNEGCDVSIVRDDIIMPLQTLDFKFITEEIRDKIDFVTEEIKPFNDTMDSVARKKHELEKERKCEIQRISDLVKIPFKEDKFTIKIRRSDYNERLFKKYNFLEKNVLKSGVVFQTHTLNLLENEFETLKMAEKKECKIVISNLIIILKEYLNSISAYNTIIALVDHYCALCDKLNDKDWSVPIVYTENESGKENYRFIAEDAFHPLVGNCIKNNVNVDFTILTGPNTAGKSTFLKTIAIIVILGQLGSLVPAKKAKFEIRDGIYIRSGASDKYGVSTFMREMKDIARITNMCTKQSLVLIDELGRGTSYIDGLSLSVAIKEYLQEKNALSLFATHFTGKNEQLFLEGEKIQLLCSEVLDGIITFKIVPGVADSLGIEIAKKVGFPDEVVRSAERYLIE